MVLPCSSLPIALSGRSRKRFLEPVVAAGLKPRPLVYSRTDCSSALQTSTPEAHNEVVDLSLHGGLKTLKDICLDVPG